MSEIRLRWLLPALMLASTAYAHAQTPTRARPDPLSAAAEVPSAQYQSSLARYQRHADQPVGSWKAVNETVNRVGGWRAYAREAQEAPAPAAAPAPASAHPASPPTPSPAGRKQP
ncbi:MAG: hypothetical protein HZC37_01370 [Burkholderiales bacterium]|nr:hypothetical protein [Burkholderiales bacterium]